MGSGLDRRPQICQGLHDSGQRPETPAVRVFRRDFQVTAFVAVCLSVLAIPAPAVAAPLLPTPADWPLGGGPVVRQGFTPPAVVWGSGHRGVDLVAKPGEAVLAAANGMVAFAGSIAGKPVVSIDHGSVRTTYEPVITTLRVGERVALGEVIGVLGAGGHVLAACTGDCGRARVISTRCCCWAVAGAGSDWYPSRNERWWNAKLGLAR
jgi:hypothetical protein